MERSVDEFALERVLSLPVLVLYGLGTTIGAGVYGLLGVVVGTAGLYAPIAFVGAAGLASLSALSFCELVARLPHAGGEAVYVGVGFGSSGLARVVGVSIAAAACLSAATVARGFIGYATVFLPLSDVVWIALLLLSLGALAAWGIDASARFAAALTVVEVSGLLLVIFACRDGLAAVPERLPELLLPATSEAWLGIGSATVLCFYSFLGFEDMINVAEEVRDVRRVMPRAILLTLGVTLALYLVLAAAAVLTIPIGRLAESRAPLALLYEAATGRSAVPIVAIGVLAMLNGALVQLIKAARILYGLGARRELPRFVARVHPTRRTPIVATGIVLAATMLCALALPIGPLARLTSSVTLGVFALTNAALLRIRRRDPRPPGIPAVPAFVPVLGVVVSVGFLAFEIAGRIAAHGGGAE